MMKWFVTTIADDAFFPFSKIEWFLINLPLIILTWTYVFAVKKNWENRRNKALTVISSRSRMDIVVRMDSVCYSISIRRSKGPDGKNPRAKVRASSYRNIQVKWSGLEYCDWEVYVQGCNPYFRQVFFMVWRVAVVGPNWPDLRSRCNVSFPHFLEVFARASFNLLRNYYERVLSHFSLLSVQRALHEISFSSRCYAFFFVVRIGQAGVIIFGCYSQKTGHRGYYVAGLDSCYFRPSSLRVFQSLSFLVLLSCLV